MAGAQHTVDLDQFAAALEKLGDGADRLSYREPLQLVSVLLESASKQNFEWQTGPANFWTWARWYRGHGEYRSYGPRKGPRPNVPRRIPLAWWGRLRRNLGRPA